MKICRSCQEEFTDKVTKCLYCGGPLETVPSITQIAGNESAKKGKGDKKSGKSWKDYKIPISAVITLMVGVVFAISQIAGLNKDSKMVIQINAPKIDAPVPAAPANVPVTEPVSAAIPANEPADATGPESAISLLKNAFAICNSGKCSDPRKAIEYLDEAIKIQPNLAEAYNNRGNAYGDLKQHERAIEDYNEAIRIKPKYAHAYYNRGLTYSDLKQYDRALEDYTQTINLKPDESNAYFNRGNIYLTQGNKEQGCSDAQKACDMGNCRLLEAARKKKDCQ